MTGMDGINSRHKMLGAWRVNQMSNALRAAAAKAQGSTVSTVGGGKLDSAGLSAACDLAAQSADMSDVRMAKVEELRESIASGNYHVPASAVADKMVAGLLRYGPRKS